MKTFVKLAVAATVLVSASAHAQYYPYYNPYDRHSIPANNYARGYNQGMANAYTGMAAGSGMFMNGFAAGYQMAQPPVIVAPAPVYGGPPPGTPYGVPVVPQGYGYGPYGSAPYAVPYIR